MTERQRQQIILGVFVLAVVWGAYMQPWKSPKKDKAPGTEPQVVAASVVPPVLVATELTPIGHVNRWTKDPFGGVAASKDPEAQQLSMTPVAAPVLQGIMVVGKVPACVIGNRILHIGDVAEGWHIREITVDAVVLVHLTDQKRLTLRPGSGLGGGGQ